MRKSRKMAQILSLLLIASACGQTDQATVTATKSSDAPVEDTAMDQTVTFYAFETDASDRNLTLLLDACEVDDTTVDVVENPDSVVITITQSISPPSTEAGEDNDRPDCSDLLEVRLQEPLSKRDVIDGTTGLIADS